MPDLSRHIIFSTNQIFIFQWPQTFRSLNYFYNRYCIYSVTSAFQSASHQPSHFIVTITPLGRENIKENQAPIGLPCHNQFLVKQGLEHRSLRSESSSFATVVNKLTQGIFWKVHLFLRNFCKCPHCWFFKMKVIFKRQSIFFYELLKIIQHPFKRCPAPCISTNEGSL